MPISNSILSNPLFGIPGVALLDHDVLEGVRTYEIRLGPSKRSTDAPEAPPGFRGDTGPAFARAWWEEAPSRLFEATSTVWVKCPEEARPAWVPPSGAKRRYEGEGLRELLSLQDFEDLRDASANPAEPENAAGPHYVWEAVLLDAIRSRRFRITDGALQTFRGRFSGDGARDNLVMQVRAQRRRILAYLRSKRALPLHFEELVRAAVLVATLDKNGEAITQVETMLRLNPWELGWFPDGAPSLGARNRMLAVKRAKGNGP